MISRSFSNEPYFNLKTKKRDGRQVPTPVWFVLRSDGTYIVLANINSGKVKRIRNFPETQAALCNWRGAVYGPWVTLTAILIEQSDDFLNLFVPNMDCNFIFSSGPLVFQENIRSDSLFNSKNICENLVNFC